MNVKILYKGIIALLLLSTYSCEDVLDIKPNTDFFEETIWSDLNLANTYLGSCYDNIGGHPNYGLGMREDLLASCTDELVAIHRPSNMTFLKGTLKSDFLGYFGNAAYSGFLKWDKLYENIQRVNIFLSKINSVPCKTYLDEARRSQMTGEALFIRAYDYTQLLLGYGGAVLSDRPFALDQDFRLINRSSLKNTMEFILSDIDQSISYLPKKGNIEQGRATKGAAAALKSRLLLFCASRLVNGGFMPADTLVSFTDGTQTERWVAARDAAKFIIDGQYGVYSLSGNSNDPPSPITETDIKNYSDNYYKIFNQKGAWNDETIWGIQYVSQGGSINKANLWNGPMGYHNWGNNQPTENIVRSFEMADGTKFQWDKYSPGDKYLREATAEDLLKEPMRNPYSGREPRFYSCVLFHGAKWQSRPADVKIFDPIGIIQTGHFYESDSRVIAFGLDTRSGLMVPWTSPVNGYFLKKFMDINIEGQSQNNTNTWVEFRYAEVLLNYAEACIELGGAELQNGLNALNLVRNRAGLPDRLTIDQNLAREYVRHERSIEFFAEGHRWYDIRRWMIAGTVIENVLAMRIKEFKDGRMEWRLDPLNVIDTRSFTSNHLYWLPVPKTELINAPHILNNPGY
jgi:hypothetical protein